MNPSPNPFISLKLTSLSTISPCLINIMEMELPHQLISLEHLSDLELYKTEKPYYLSEIPSRNQPSMTNLAYTLHENTPVYDIRGLQAEFSLAKNSFTFVNKTFASAESAGRGEKDGIDAFLREVAEWIESEHGAERVICYDFRVNSRSTQLGAGLQGPFNPRHSEIG